MPLLTRQGDHRAPSRVPRGLSDIGSVIPDQRFADAKKAAQYALGHRDTVTVLSVALSRIYTLRNQLMHGGATWSSSVNRDQLRDCTNLMGKLVPLLIEIMLDHPETFWGDACYPVVK
jgi:hypothetical protein